MFGNNWRAAGRAAAGLAAAGASLALVALTARADPYTPYPNSVDAASVGDVTVYAPYRYVRQPTTGRLVRMLNVSMTVPIGDLDLSTHEGAVIAKARIVRAARDVCDEAERAYTASGEPPGGCYNRAVADAMRQAQDQAGYPIVAWGYR